ncbi:MAG: hypothetical protein M3R25_08500 [Bacteroidota bacterium]|nr:hypothetical protein [Bacteroidota bacterium]
MEKIILIIIALAFTSYLKAQEWFPQGASWYYSQTIFIEGETYAHFEVVGEITIQGKNCKIISGRCACQSSNDYILYQEGDKIYSLHSEADSFRLLYDFSLVAGDTLIFRGEPEPGGDGYFLIDSVTTIQLGSQNLRVQHITHLSYGLEWGNKIIERIGSNGCLYPQVSFCDPLTGGLRCYEDDQIGLINFQSPPRPCDYTTTATTDLSKTVAIKVYPNPASISLHVEAELPIVKLVLFNNLSIPVYQRSSIFNTNFALEHLSLPGGVYHIQVVMSDHQVAHKTVVIQ